MANMMHKMAALALAGCMLFGSAGDVVAAANGQAARASAQTVKQQEKAAKKAAKEREKAARRAAREQEKAAKRAAKEAKRQKFAMDTVLHAEIVGYEQGNVYLLDEGNGPMIRADLGENGGRLWRLTPMKFSGTFVQDAKGRLFKMGKVEYKDPIENPRRRRGKEKAATTSTVTQKGDEALYRGKQVPTDNATYITQNLAGVTDTSAYREVGVREMNQAPVGTKVTLVGRPIETVTKDKVMKFWDRGNNPFYVLMNGGFIPLGQRSLLYGSVGRGNDGVTYLSLEKIDSIQ